ncbi:FAD-dependent oxidoreductase [Bacillus sp. REN10]|uniref:NAD(P)/FAD-dependent oxidoreductase n=1 Tax=Bacillus sp. REN10 TaxID=2782541 RepID=UPI00193B59B9|nr:FAD-dependent oxidoreductase [Bacillus sp. REN10]
MNKVNTLIIGAGISGLLAAHTLQRLAIGTFHIIDKGRSPGGRFATRRIATGTFDHGAQFFTARSEEFQALVAQWEEKGWIRPWFTEKHPRYVGEGGMNRLAKRLAEGVPVDYQCEVTRISASDNGGYVVEGMHTGTRQLFHWQADTVLLTSPLPQSVKLLDAGGHLLTGEQREVLNRAKYVPTLGVLLKVNGEVNVPHGYLREPKRGMISWIADNQQKGISASGAITVHMDHDWSKRYFEEVDDAIVEQALPLIREVAGHEWTTEEVQVKRWRYAQVEHPIQRDFLDIGTAHSLVLAGDAFAGQEETTATRVEHAVLSGIRAGEYIAKHQKE